MFKQQRKQLESDLLSFELYYMYMVLNSDTIPILHYAIFFVVACNLPLPQQPPQNLKEQ